jgi:hypothetical protein
MKHIYKLSIIMLAVFTFTGCSVDDDDPVMNAASRQVTAMFADQSSIIGIPDNTATYDLTVAFSEALPSYSTIEYTLNGVAASANGNSGDTSMTISIPFGNENDVASVSLANFIIVNADARRVIPTIGGNISTTIIKEGAVSATLRWDDTSVDLDFDLDIMTATWGWAFVTPDASSNGTNAETVSAVLTDGNYAFWIWNRAGVANVPYTIEVTTAAGTQTFSGTVSGNSWNLWFTKSGTNYTFFEDDPA